VRDPIALDGARCELAGEIDRVSFTQFLWSRQARGLKEYANAKGVRLIGDLPFFVSPDSSDVWAHPEFFLLDENRRPRFVAGVPPNGVSSQGQLWGNPVYNWEALRQTGYGWCIDRVRAALAQVDVVRLDHFRGFAGAWHVPAHAPTAQCGQWVGGPGAAFFDAVQGEIGGLPFVAEDLRMTTANVGKLLDDIAAPGTRVLQFAFDGHSDNPHLPDNYIANSVVYTGTHDSPTTRGWYEDLPPLQRKNLWRYLRRKGEAADAAPGLIHAAWSSPAALAMAPLQDVLNLGKDPAAENRHWRATEEMLQARAFEWLRELTKRTNRQSADSRPRTMGVAS
jgi:4-alpha-glucanotransferase